MTGSRPLRAAWSEIDRDALAHNVRAVRTKVGPHVRLYAVCKNDAYGCGAKETARTILDAGADAFAVADPADARRIRDAGVAAPILLYAATTPDAAQHVAALGLTVTIHDFESLNAFASAGRTVRASIEVDCGYGRLGFTPDQWHDVFSVVRTHLSMDVVGLYTHFSNVEDAAAVARQARLFAEAAALAKAFGFDNLEVMASSSRMLIGYPELNLNAVNPGRMLYGMMEKPWDTQMDLRPVVKAVKTRILQVKSIPADFPLAHPRHLSAPGTLRTAVISFGFKDGLPRNPHGGCVLVRGQRAPIIGPRATEHTIIDVSGIDAAAGDEVVIVGEQLGASISAPEAVEQYRMEMIELIPRITVSTERVYV